MTARVSWLVIQRRGKRVYLCVDDLIVSFLLCLISFAG